MPTPVYHASRTLVQAVKVPLMYGEILLYGGMGPRRITAKPRARYGS